MLTLQTQDRIPSLWRVKLDIIWRDPTGTIRSLTNFLEYPSTPIDLIRRHLILICFTTSGRPNLLHSNSRKVAAAFKCVGRCTKLIYSLKIITLTSKTNWTYSKSEEGKKKENVLLKFSKNLWELMNNVPKEYFSGSFCMRKQQTLYMLDFGGLIAMC